MLHDPLQNYADPSKFAGLGHDAIAYMRRISAEEIERAFPGMPELEAGRKYWALFAADGTPLVLANEQNEIASTAFYNNLLAVQPN